MTKRDRQLEIGRLIHEGANAFHMGKTIGSCPYVNHDAEHWLKGYRDAQEAVEQSKVSKIRDQIHMSEDVDDLKHAVLELMNLLEDKGVI